MSISTLFSPTTPDADGVCASQTLGGAGHLTINAVIEAVDAWRIAGIINMARRNAILAPL